MSRKPLGRKSYGHIPHLPGSRIGPGDHKCSDGQGRIACEKTRDKHDYIIVQEKLDGSNVGVALKDDQILAITRAGYLTSTSPFEMHHQFGKWVAENESRFRAVLTEDQRICGEWLLVAHGTKYNLPHEPFVVFDIMTGTVRLPFDQFQKKALKGGFVIPHVIYQGREPISIQKAMNHLETFGFHGALEQIEGAVWRVERDILIDKKLGNKGNRQGIVDYLVKYVRPDKKDGKYLDSISGEIIYNEYLSG